MLYVFISVFCSVTVSVILKLARQYAVDTTQIIVWNYPMAVLLTFLFLQPNMELLTSSVPGIPWLIYMTLAILLPGIFLILSQSIRYTGIVKTEIAQRLSLFIPLMAAFLIFGEQLSIGVVSGILVGLLAILCSIGWHKEGNVAASPSIEGTTGRGLWLYPLIVFFGYGIVDILFKQIARVTHVPYTTSIFVVFVLAMVLAFSYLLYIYLTSRKRLSPSAILWGAVLGAFNFSNILFYMKAHRALPDNPSLVFTGMNIGVIALGALVGVLFFNEKLSLLNKIGLFLALVSIAVIAVNT